MKHTNKYEVAGHQFAVTADECLLQQMERQYKSFQVDNITGVVLFRVETVKEEEFPSTEGLTEEIVLYEDFVKILIGHVGSKLYYEFFLWGQCEGRILVDENRHTALVTTPHDALYAVNQAITLMYTLTTAQKGTALFHSSVVEHGGKGYLFLGKSGTGKSTHSSLWLKYIQGTQLVNDDNPVVRVNDDGTATVYGSPWSGKTPCYRNVSYPIGGIVRLDQAPENRIQRLKGAVAYATILPSISGKRWDKAIAEGLNQTECKLVENVPIWHLECRPDEEAARLCYEAVKNNR